MRADNTAGPEKKLSLFIILLLLLVTVAVFWQVGGHDFVSYDDTGYVTANAVVRGGLTGDGIRWAFSSLHEANWHPLTWLSHMADCQFYGLDPRGHHLTNVALHLANVLVLFLLLGRLKFSRWVSGGVALLFSVHPLHVESVAWVAERKDLLAAFFFLLALLAHVACGRHAVRRYLLVIPLFICGLLAKPMVVTLPCVLLLLDWWPLDRVGQVGYKRLLLEKVPLFVLSLASAIVTIEAQNRWDAVPTLQEIPFGARLANLPVAYVRYLGKMLWPADLAVFYPYRPVSWWLAGAALLFLVAVTVLVLRCRRRAPFLSFGWFWYVGMLVPVVGIVQVGEQSLADRYTYLPLIGVAVIVVSAAEMLWRRWSVPAAAGVVAGGLAILLLATAAYRQAGYWRDSMTLFSHAIAVTNGNYLALSNLGTALAEKGEVARGDALYREALRANPRYAPAHYNLGVSLADQGDLGGAEASFRTAIAIKPRFAEAHYNLGVMLARQERYREASEEFLAAVRLDPDNAAARHNLELAQKKAAGVRQQ